jgi:hypothetical protein
MGADNVIEADIVTPSGELVTANVCHNPDLLFAIRGGGGSTYGVVISAVMKAYPTPQTSSFTFFMTSKNGTTNNQFYDLAAYLLSEFPRLKDNGMQGYFGFRQGGKLGARVLSMNWNLLLYNKPNGTAERLFAPIKQRLENENATVSYFARSGYASTFYKHIGKALGGEPAATGGGAMGGWLLPRSALMNITKLARAVQTVGPTLEGPSVRDLEE